jgi:hypothetical protein
MIVYCDEVRLQNNVHRYLCVTLNHNSLTIIKIDSVLSQDLIIFYCKFLLWSILAMELLCSWL